ncbi:hypothetical protein [Streptomyces aureus]|uniref:hypothetical protein n=1 Tax=Streptomyces aureus TaxID=193461 RepID=UPI0031E15468
MEPGRAGGPARHQKTYDAYRTLKANLTAGILGKPSSKRYRRAVEKPIAFRPQGAQPYDDRMLSWQYTQRTVSIWPQSGRMKEVAFTAAPNILPAWPCIARASPICCSATACGS